MHVPSLYTALRKTTWGGLFPVLQGDQFRSPLARERKGVVPSSYLTTADKSLTASTASSSSAQLSSSSQSKRVHQHSTTSSPGTIGQDRRGVLEPSSSDRRRDGRDNRSQSPSPTPSGGGSYTSPTTPTKSMSAPLFMEDSEVDQKKSQQGGRTRPAIARRRKAAPSPSSSSS